MENEIVKFEAGKTYYYRFISSYDTVVKCTIIKRTAKTITFKDDCGETMTRRIYILDGVEKVAIGHYSMAPTMGADRTAEALEEAEKKAEEAREEAEKQEEESRQNARETAQKVAEGAVALFTAMHPIKEGQPTVKIGNSEMWGLPGFRDADIEVSVKAADKIFGTLDAWQHEIREKSDFFGWYHKTDFTICYKDENGEEGTYQGRYDIGDGEGGLLNHIRNFGEWHRTHEEFGKEKAIPDETNDILEFVKMLEKAA